MRNCVGWFGLTAIFSCFVYVCSDVVLYLPLDERFTTRDAFLNLARVTPFDVVTPDPAIIPHLRVPANLTALAAFVDANVASANSVIMSAEMFLYGGLIASRTSNDTQAEVAARLLQLAAYKAKYPQIQFYVSSVVMRIENANYALEDVWYWAYYGQDLYTYSYFYCKYLHSHNQSDLQTAKAAEAKVPSEYVADFLWRRSRNFNITKLMLEKLHEQPSLFNRVSITLDDNAQYGFSVEEAAQLAAIVQQYQLQDRVFIYPGADEVGLTLLSQMSVQTSQSSPTMQLVFRDPTTVYRIPNYEGASASGMLRFALRLAVDTTPPALN
eukprot:TRINITY_DN15373_c0_g1_i1.p1 TRINITY_DN15373_c0_g1~~TRINITY_DN15373_c0_g1_i1.p1  ORF type:complete len:326 (+),score=101.91 TRINITY_DN15373_c0_g1_i1:99-1076(+)